MSCVAQPVRRLVAFARRPIGAGETMTVSFGIGLEQLGCWDVEEQPTRFAVEPDAFVLYVGSSLHATQELTLEVL